MNERVFLAFRGLAIFIHCFPGLGPSERHTPCVLCLLVDQKLALRWTDISREKALFLLLRNYGGPPPYSEATPQSKTPPSGLLGGDPFERSRRASWMGILGGCTFPLLYHVLDLRTFHSTSCLGLLLTRDLFWSCPGLLDVVEQGTGGFGREVGSPSPQRNLCNLSSLSSPTSLCLFVCLFVCKCLFV